MSDTRDLKQLSNKSGLSFTLRSWIAIFAMLLLLLCSLPYAVEGPKTGLDNSWSYAINVAAKKGLSFGKDIFFTYGPLGYLASPLDIGCNAIIFYLFNALMLLIQALILIRCFQYGIRRGVSAAAFLIITGQICNPFWEYYYEYVFLLLINLCLVETTAVRSLCLYCAAALTCCAIFIKFSLFFPLFGTLILFCIVDRLYHGKWSKPVLLTLLGIPLVITCAYLLYLPSFSAFINYLRVSFEISSEYNAAMSLWPKPGMLRYAIFSLACCSISCVAEFFVNCKLFLQTLLFTPAVFVAFKHGYVRADMHTMAFFSAILSILGIKLLFGLFLCKREAICLRNTRRFAAIVAFAMLALLCGCSLYVANVSPQQYVQFAKDKAKAVYSIASDSGTQTDQIHTADILPQSFLDRIGKNSIAVYPWELSIGAYNDIDIKFMPVLQAYSAYSPSLDTLDASFFENESTAPHYIILSTYTIDERLPFIENPATWNAIYCHYNAVMQSDSYILLERMQQPYQVIEQWTWQKEVSLSEGIELPLYPNETELLFSIDMQLSPKGKILQLLYHVPTVDMVLQYEDGSKVVGRIVPANLSTDSFVNVQYAAKDQSEILKTINGQDKNRRITSIRFESGGMDCYLDDAVCTLKTTAAKKPVYSMLLPEPVR